MAETKKGKGSLFIDFPRSHQVKAAKVMLSIFFPLSRKSTLTILSLSYFDGRWKIEGAIRTQFPPELMCSLYPLSISRHSISHNLKAMMPCHFKSGSSSLCSEFFLGKSKLQVYGTKYFYLHYYSFTCPVCYFRKCPTKIIVITHSSSAAAGSVGGAVPCVKKLLGLGIK